MYQIKSRIYKNFDKTQKTAVCNYLRAITKQEISAGGYSVETILNKFIENEKYYLELNASRFPFLGEVIEDAEFLKDTQDYIKECIIYYEYKNKQKPLIEAQKEFDKKKRKFLQEVKMSKEAPTPKQLYYYDRLCKKYSIDKRSVEELSRLDLKNEIERILDEHSDDYKNVN